MQFFIYYLISFFLVAFGQPATSMLCSIAAAIFGYSLFFTACAEKTPKTRFILGMLFFTGVQLVQTSWLTSHFYNYIYVLYFLLAVVLGVQFGALSYFASKERIMHIPSILALSSLWTLLEWSRLFYFTGYTFNPIGLAMSGSEPLLQCASFFGIYGLSFWVMFGNLFLCRCYFRYAESKSILAIIQALIIIAFPFAVGYCMNTVHERAQKQYDQAHGPFQALILHTTMLPEEVDFVIKNKDPASQAFDEWEQLINTIAPFQKTPFDLILFPEIVVPFSAHAPIYDYAKMSTVLKNAFQNYSPEELKPTEVQGTLMVSSASIAQVIASAFGCPILIGLEGLELYDQKHSYYNSAYFFFPHDPLCQTSLRYDKQVLFPMAEYIPANWVKPLAARYGLFDSFSHGTRPIIAVIHNQKVAASICYEDTFANLMQKNRQAGATLLANLSNDGWYPNSALAIQHLEHARLRAVENGVPLLRSCNYGISCAIDSLGRSAHLISDTAEVSAIPVSVSTYTYPTLYSRFGNAAIVLISVLLLAFGILKTKRNEP